MARGKKKESALTPEEKLAQALVPVEEQPYKVPKNWCWTALGNLIELISGRDAALSACNDQGYGIPYILGASNIENNVFHVERWIANPEVVSLKGDILLSVKGTIGKLYIQCEDEINISRQIMAIRPRDELCTKLVYLYLQLICEELREAGNGLIPGISRKDILERCFPLAPKGEQQRIVDRVEYLFAKLDEAKEKAQSVLDSFETRKAAILHKAFTGELTAKWRAEHGVGIENWTEQTIGDLIKVSSGKALTAKNMVSDGEIPVYGGNGVTGYHNESNVEPDTVVIGRVGYYCGSVHYIAGPAWVTDNALIVSYRQEINKQYLVHLLRHADLRQNDSSTAQPVVSGSKIYPIVVHTAPLNEQSEIVRILDSLFTKEQQAKEAAEAVLEKIDLLKKSILARAFRGELGTNDPAEQSALELLKQIL